MSDHAAVAQQPVAVLTVTTAAGPSVTVALEQVAVFVAAAGQGAAGRDGRDGIGGGGATTTFRQDVPAAVWTIRHGLGRYPSVTLVDTANDAFDASARYVDSNTIVVTMAAPTAGIAYLN